MSNDFKFEAWDKQESRLIRWEEVCKSLELIIKEAGSRFIIRRFSGLSDRCNKEIYEGDIVCDNYDEFSPNDARNEGHSLNCNWVVCYGLFNDNPEGYGGNALKNDKCHITTCGWYLQRDGVNKSMAAEMYHSFGTYRGAQNKLFIEVVGNIYETK